MLRALIRITYWIPTFFMVGWLCWGLTSQSTIFQSCRDGAIASWVINQYFRGVKCLAQGHNTAEVGLEPRTSRSGVRHSTTEPPHSPHFFMEKYGKLLLKSKVSYFCNIPIISVSLNKRLKPEAHWSCIAHLSAEDMLKASVIEEKKFKHSPWAGAANPLGPKFWCQQVGLITMVMRCKFKKNLDNLWLYTSFPWNKCI